jgi:hygromycin-B 4-O-kinase
MSSVKTKVDEEEVKEFLKQKYSSQVSNFQFIKGGQLSQPFSYVVNGKSYVIRFRQDIESFEKEKAIYALLSKGDPNIPLPKLHEIGVFQETEEDVLYFSINNKCEGNIGYSFSREIINELREPLIEYLFRINQIDISNTKNFGDWLKLEEASHQSWREFLHDYIQSKLDYLINFFKDDPEEVKYVKTLGDRIRDLFHYCPEERYLIHGDYGLHNLIATDDGEITGILDWELSKFGDFVYDVSWLDYWGKYDNQSYKEEYLEYYESQKGGTIEHYSERTLCYILCVGLHMAWFYCISGQIDGYYSGKKHLTQFS